MTNEDQQPDSPQGFADLLSEIGEDSSFSWDGEELEAGDEATRPVVTFRIGADYFAVAGDAVREVVGTTEPTELPGAPDHIRGITILRRQVVGLLSLRRFLEIPTPSTQDGHGDPSFPAESESSRTLIVETAHYTVGLLVDEITGLDDWPESALDLRSLPENIHDATRRFARGARTVNDNVYVYLDLEALLDVAAIQ